MNYELNIKTGGSTIENCRAVADFSNLQGLVLDDRFVMFSAKSGINQSLASFNGQTLSEAEFSEVVLPFVTFKETSGEYFIDSGTSFKNAKFSRDFSTSGFSSKNLIYENREQSNFAIFSSQNTGDFSSGIITAISSISNLDSLEDLDFFINGQKLYSGQSYLISGEAGDILFNGTPIEYNGQTLSFGGNVGFTYLEEITGKMFAVKKNPNSVSFLEENPDFFGVAFIEKNCNYYWNGMEVSPDLWIETNTGVKTIVTGKAASLSFDSNEYEEFTL